MYTHTHTRETISIWLIRFAGVWIYLVDTQIALEEEGRGLPRSRRVCWQLAPSPSRARGSPYWSPCSDQGRADVSEHFPSIFSAQAASLICRTVNTVAVTFL